MPERVFFMKNKQKHLEFIQGIINRMAGNLFFLKGWAVTLIAGLFALSAKDSNPKYALIAYFPVIIFWILDGYFLSQERLFRDLYNDVSKLKEKDINFSMNIEKYKAYSKNTWISSIFSSTLLLFYLSLILSMTLIKFLVIDNGGKKFTCYKHGEANLKIHENLPSEAINFDGHCEGYYRNRQKDW